MNAVNATPNVLLVVYSNRWSCSRKILWLCMEVRIFNCPQRRFLLLRLSSSIDTFGSGEKALCWQDTICSTPQETWRILKDCDCGKYHWIASAPMRYAHRRNSVQAVCILVLQRKPCEARQSGSPQFKDFKDLTVQSNTTAVADWTWKSMNFTALTTVLYRSTPEFVLNLRFKPSWRTLVKGSQVKDSTSCGSLVLVLGQAHSSASSVEETTLLETVPYKIYKSKGTAKAGKAPQ